MKTVELVFIPSLGMGHLTPMVELAKAMIQRDDRLSASILVMINSSMDFGVNKFLESVTLEDSSNSNPRLRFIDLRQFKDPDETEPEINPQTFVNDIVNSHKPHVRRFVQTNDDSDSPKLAGFIVDMFCATMKDIADVFGVPTYIFFSSSVGFLGLGFHFQTLKHDGKEDTSKYKDSDAELSILCYENPVPVKVLPVPMYQNLPAADLFFDCVKKFRETKGIMVNTFANLEPYGVKSLSEAESVPPVYPVGPLLNLDGNGHGRNNQSQSDSIMRWLDNQPPCSVVFLCFGSFGSFEEDQIREIATALEGSGQQFLWSLRRRPEKGKFEFPADYEDPTEVLPEGFLERTKEVGKVIGWAPQMAVLSHPATGAFVSHCGWNSILESVWCGVPIATWPLYAEQQINAFALIKEIGIAAEIKMDYNIESALAGGEAVKLVSAEEIQSGIVQIMSDDNVKRKVKELKEMSRKAMLVGGSSYEALGTVTNDFLHCSNAI